jgi:hypothetical protein
MHYSWKLLQSLAVPSIAAPVLLLWFASPHALASDDCAPADNLAGAARDVLAVDPGTASAAIAQLRAAGQPGLDALLSKHATEIGALRGGTVRLDDPSVARLRAAIDAVARQRDAFASGLFWHTSLDNAKADARKRGLPILSLRLLGNLDEEFSCANSRFFRTTLYVNSTIAKLLKESFVLHWQSERPVPRITVDFGDGRKIERTVTGNSIHYVLDADGTIVDAFPGLFGAETFATLLKQAARTAHEGAPFSMEERLALYARRHRDALAALEAEWNRDLTRLGIDALTFAVVQNDLTQVAAQEDRVEDLLSKVAALHRDDARLDKQSRALLRVKNPTADLAGERAVSKRVVESPLLRAFRNLEQSIALDTVRNEFIFHARLHRWLLEPEAAKHLEKVNARVYAQLFLTPNDDPWLGMAPADAIAALDDNGIFKTPPPDNAH